jgi:hypothetical protein
MFSAFAITNSCIVALNERSVSFRYKHRQPNGWRTRTLEGAEFIRRFLQHVLPEALHNVRLLRALAPEQTRHRRQSPFASTHATLAAHLAPLPGRHQAISGLRSGKPS